MLAGVDNLHDRLVRDKDRLFGNRSFFTPILARNYHGTDTARGYYALGAFSMGAFSVSATT